MRFKDGVKLHFLAVLILEILLNFSVDLTVYYPNNEITINDTKLHLGKGPNSNVQWFAKRSLNLRNV